MLSAEEARDAVHEAEEAFVEAARQRFGPVGDTRETRERYEARLASLVAAYDQATLVGP
jgi:hypothetical protein